MAATRLPKRQADKFRFVICPTAKGCAAACIPEANALVHKENVSREPNILDFKAMFLRFVPHASRRRSGRLHGKGGHLVLQTIRSHDQYNTTFYGLDDRYRAISGGRRVILVHPEDLAELGFADRDLVDVVSTFRGQDRQADKFRLVA